MDEVDEVKQEILKLFRDFVQKKVLIIDALTTLNILLDKLEDRVIHDPANDFR